MVELLQGFGLFIAYYLCGVAVLLLIRRFCRPPEELFRKMLHILCMLSAFVLLDAFETWYLSAGTALLFAVLVYPILSVLDKHTSIGKVLIERKSGELRSSLVIAFVMMAALITVYWGLLGEAWRPVIFAAIMAWGLGDAAAALVGKAYGTRPVKLPFADRRKTVEGTLAMCAAAGLSVFVTLLAATALPWYGCAVMALVAAPVASYIELVSPNGIDTITVPFAVAALLFLLMRIGGF